MLIYNVLLLSLKKISNMFMRENYYNYKKKILNFRKDDILIFFLLKYGCKIIFIKYFVASIKCFFFILSCNIESFWIICFHFNFRFVCIIFYINQKNTILLCIHIINLITLNNFPIFFFWFVSI